MAELDPSLSNARFELGVVPERRAVLHLKAWARDAGPTSLAPMKREPMSAGAKFAGALGSMEGDARLLTLAPGEWLMWSDSLDGPQLHAAMADLARSHGMAAVDLSHGIAGLEVRGTAARDVLSMGCGLDLDARSFPAGACARTRFAQLPVVIECTHSEPRYELYVATSYRSYLRAWLEDAASSS